MHGVKKTLNKILRETEAEEFVIYLTGEGNFREEVATTAVYKGNRDPNHKPHWYKEIKDYLIGQWDAVVVEGYEADDAQAIEQCTSPPKSTIICGVDKDLHMIPGLHYNWMKNLLWEINETDAIRNFYKQLLTGDATDNIKGITGIGPKRASKILDDVHDEKEMLCTVGRMYAIHFDHPEERMIENGKLLWMMREHGQEWEIPNV